MHFKCAVHVLCFMTIALRFVPLSANPQDLQLVNAFPNLSFSQPVFLTHSGDGSHRLFVVEQSGIIRVFPNDASATTSAVFLDIRSRVTSGGEMGLLGLAFHPEFPDSGFFYVNYTTSVNGPRRTIISRFSVNAGTPDQADPNSEFILMQFNQPFSNHNGGMLQFGPDGMLYISTGDGGSANDPSGNGQSLMTLLGKILRIDVDRRQGDLNYAIPADNPFVGAGNGVREEIFAYGLRNPWRFSIDAESGQIWAGDVGQNRIEEIDRIEKGRNYGWNRMEGSDCFDPQNPNNPPANCDTSGLTLPVVDYGRSLGNSVTGGYIYRGSLRPEFAGAYIYGDFGSGRLFLLRYENGMVTADSMLIDTNFGIASFGTDENDELYLVSLLDGRIYRFTANPATSISETGSEPNRFLLHQNYPNPFNPSTQIEFTLNRASKIRLDIYNLLGEKIATLLDDDFPQGSFRAVWSGRDDAGQPVPSGVYLYAIKSGAVRQVKKMLLIK